MRFRHAAVAALLAAAATTLAAEARAQSWSDAQLEAWEFIQSEWQASMDEDASRYDLMFHDAFQGWDAENPAPRGLASTRRWSDLNQATTLAFELHPLAIVVTGNTAVAHYVWSEMSEDADGERETTHGRYTDVLVRGQDGWRFLAWQGGAAPGDD